MNLLADTATEWTAMGLLVVVLFAVGKFLWWYLPQREKAFADVIAEDRVVWLGQLTKEQERSERVIHAFCAEFHQAVSKFEAANTANTAAISQVRDSLRDLHDDIRQMIEE